MGCTLLHVSSNRILIHCIQPTSPPYLCELLGLANGASKQPTCPSYPLKVLKIGLMQLFALVSLFFQACCEKVKRKSIKERLGGGEGGWGPIGGLTEKPGSAATIATVKC